MARVRPEDFGYGQQIQSFLSREQRGDTDNYTLWASRAEHPHHFGIAGELAVEHVEEEVGLLAFDERYRVWAPGVLGVAEHHARTERGTSLIPSGDLSPHSSRLISKLQLAGAVSERASTEVSNDYDFNEARLRPTRTAFTPELLEAYDLRVKPADIQAGRVIGRQLVRNISAAKKRGIIVPGR